MKTRVKVSITTVEGELLEQYFVVTEEPSNPIMLAQQLADLIYCQFETEES